MINNFDTIRELIKDDFTTTGDFFFIQILQRRKDNPEMVKAERNVDNFFIYSLEELDKMKEKIIASCERWNGRAYIRLNKRNDEKIALQTLRLIAENIATKNYNIRNCYLSCCGQFNSSEQKRWLIDIDTYETITVNQIRVIVEELQKEIGEVYCKIIPTKNGLHLITTPFNLAKFRESFMSPVEVHKDHSTVLYIPDFEVE